jgi:hypothetical protein
MDDLDRPRLEVVQDIATYIVDDLTTRLTDESQAEIVNGTATALWWMMKVVLERTDPEDKEANRVALEAILMDIWTRLSNAAPTKGVAH